MEGSIKILRDDKSKNAEETPGEVEINKKAISSKMAFLFITDEI